MLACVEARDARYCGIRYGADRYGALAGSPLFDAQVDQVNLVDWLPSARPDEMPPPALVRCLSRRHLMCSLYDGGGSPALAAA